MHLLACTTGCLTLGLTWVAFWSHISVRMQKIYWQIRTILVSSVPLLFSMKNKKETKKTKIEKKNGSGERTQKSDTIGYEAIWSFNTFVSLRKNLSLNTYVYDLLSFNTINQTPMHWKTDTNNDRPCRNLNYYTNRS